VTSRSRREVTQRTEETAVALIESRAILPRRNNEGLSKYIENVIYDGEIMLYIMCREYAENELQRQRIAVIILILFS